MAASSTRKNPIRLLLICVAGWTALITLAHLAANVGFSGFAEDARVALGLERRSLRVGFLPVT